LGGTLTFTKNYDDRQAAISNVLTFTEKLSDHYARMALSVSDDAEETVFYESSVPKARTNPDNRKAFGSKRSSAD
jgi:hypothetical protein